MKQAGALLYNLRLIPISNMGRQVFSIVCVLFGKGCKLRQAAITTWNFLLVSSYYGGGTK